MDTSILTVVVGLFGSFFALMKHMIDKNMKQQDKMQQTFLEHLEKKNGYNERICDKFDKTIQGFQTAMNESTNTLRRAVEQHDTILETITEVKFCMKDFKNSKMK